VFFRFLGPLQLAETEQMVATFEGVYKQEGRLYLLFDGSRLTTIDSQASRRFVNWTQSYPITAIANFGGGLMQRTLALLVLNAIRLVGKRAPPQTYVSTEAEARAWLAEQRHRQLG
jgi:hypothetical protein